MTLGQLFFVRVGPHPHALCALRPPPRMPIRVRFGKAGCDGLWPVRPFAWIMREGGRQLPRLRPTHHQHRDVVELRRRPRERIDRGNHFVD